jgi:hypothetical protein
MLANKRTTSLLAFKRGFEGEQIAIFVVFTLLFDAKKRLSAVNQSLTSTLLLLVVSIFLHPSVKQQEQTSAEISALLPDRTSLTSCSSLQLLLLIVLLFTDVLDFTVSVTSAQGRGGATK